ncbi:hypothetical protein LSH36_100g09009 [Paralvinella palmiformis]|uniref:Uncharacterized protein n=1 Tax=Paralvinella palmiformis TaxID=53620 RepID=A0AAD9JZH5_9ANNE|nr:hypothetical protein LSH36_100g09009 [Paralvinella palmiformis]
MKPADASKFFDAVKLTDADFVSIVCINTDMFCIYIRLIARQKNIQNTLNAIHRFDADLKDYFLWLTKVDLVLKRHDEMTANRNASDDDLQEVTRAFKLSLVSPGYDSQVLSLFDGGWYYRSCRPRVPLLGSRNEIWRRIGIGFGWCCDCG